MMKRTYILHPYIVSIYVVLFPLSQNISYVGIGSIRALFISILIAQILLIIGKIILKQPVKVSLLVSGLYILFFSYGHVEAILQDSIYVSAFLRVMLIILWLVIFGLWIYWVLLKMKHARTVSNYFNIVAAILVVFPIYDLITYSRMTPETERLAQEYQQYIYEQNDFQKLFDERVSKTGETPDIYYIILDGYTRADVLEELYGYDNSDFINELEKRGFYVAPNSHSNYSDTVYSLASSLNMTHVNTIVDFLDERGISGDEEFMKDILSILIKDNVLMQFLREQGYQVVAFDSGYDRTNIETADNFVRSEEIGEFNIGTAFEFMLLDTTFGKLLFDFLDDERVPMQGFYDEHRARILFNFNNIPEFSDLEGSLILFAHIVTPHAPYVFGPNGEERSNRDPFSLQEGTTLGEWAPEYYRDQVIYSNKLILTMVDRILANSDDDPIIIIQADHGSRAYRDDNLTIEDRTNILYSIFNAYYLPDANEKELFQANISPINTFRVLLNYYFSTELNLLENDVYSFDSVTTNGGFLDVCKENIICSDGQFESK